MSSRRDFLKKGAILGGASLAGAAAMHLGDMSALALPSASSSSVINQWSGMGYGSVLVWVDASGNYYVKDTGLGPQVGALIVNASVITTYGASLGAGTSGNSTVTGGIQEAVNCLTTGGVINLAPGIYNCSLPISLPWGLTFIFNGSGVPSFVHQAGSATYNTPSDGTQIRGSSYFNNYGNRIGIFQRVTGASQQGALYFYHLAIMPDYIVTSSGTKVECVWDGSNGVNTSISNTYDDVIFAPWGWTEAGSPIGSGTYNLNSLYVELGGNGTFVRFGEVKMLGLYEANGGLTADYFVFDHLYYNHCLGEMPIVFYSGINGASLAIEDMNGYLWNPQSTNASITVINKIFIEGNHTPPYLFYVGSANFQLFFIATIEIWNYVGGTTNLAYVVATTGPASADYYELLYPCQMWTGGATGGTEQLKTFPIAVELGTPFGGTISTPFGANSGPVSGGGIGTGGNSANPTGTTLYTANEPVDVSWAAGTGTVTTKDNFGNVIDNAVASLSHRLLYPNFTITFSATQSGTVTVVQATVGTGPFVGSTATAQVGVKYVAMKRIYVSDSVSTGTMTSYDGNFIHGTNPPEGLAMDTAVAVPFVRYTVDSGQIVVFGTAAPVAGSSCVIVQQ
jgi:hypothetical protein